MAIMVLRVRLWMASRGPLHGHVREHARGRVHANAGRRMQGRARTRRPGALLFPIALLMATATIVLVARFGGVPKCAATATAATAKPISRGKLTPEGQKISTCPRVPNLLFMGR